MKGEEEVSERMLNEIEASQLSDIESETMVYNSMTHRELPNTIGKL